MLQKNNLAMTVATCILAFAVVAGGILAYGQQQAKVNTNKEAIVAQSDTIVVMQNNITEVREKVAGLKAKVDETHEMVQMLVRKELGEAAVAKAKEKANGEEKKEEI